MKKNDSPDVKEFFTATATIFSSNYQSAPEFQERQQIWERLIEKHLPESRKDSICIDLGCGNGLLSRFVSKKGIKTIGFDQSAGMLSLARQKEREDFQSTTLNFLNASLPLPEDLYQKLTGKPGLILCSSVLEYVPDYKKVLEQCHHMLIPGGKMIVSFPNESSIYRIGERIFKKMPLFGSSYLKYQKHQFNAGEVRKLLTDMKFKVLDEIYFALPFQKYLSPLLSSRRSRWLATMFLFVVQKVESDIFTSILNNPDPSEIR